MIIKLKCSDIAFKMVLVLVMAMICLPAFSQHELRTESRRAIKNYEMGLQAYRQRDYRIAEMYLLEAIEADGKFQNAYMVLAEVYWDRQELSEAVRYYGYGTSLDSSFYPRAFYNMGRLEIRLGRYENAKSNFETFLKYQNAESEDGLRALRGIEQAEFGIWSMAHPVEFEPVNLGSNINSPEDDYWPSLSADGQTLVITRLVTRYDVTLGNFQQEDFYYSTREDTTWTKAQPLGPPLNTQDNEGAQSISADGRTMVYTVCNRQGVIGRCDIYISKFENGEWSEPRNMGVPLNSTAKETQPSLNADGTVVYFASNRPGGKGGLDIWMSKRLDNGDWSEPSNLGDTINTPADEMSPFIHHDGKTLYFSSNGHLGMGGFDLFRAEQDKSGKWGEVMNLGYPINTHRDEIGMIVNATGNMAYFSSDIRRNRGKDIYRFELYSEARPREVSYLKGTVFDEVTRVRLGARFELFDLEDGSLVSQSESDPRTGEFLVAIPADHDYMLNVTRSGYLFYSDNFALRGIHHIEEPFLKDIPLKPIETGQAIVLKNIFFETDSYALKSTSQHELGKVVRFLENNPGLKVEISGHTDNVGTAAYNQQLSEQRARSVVNYLKEHGIAPERLTYRGYGFEKPLESNETDEGRASNRRTELKVIE